MRNPRAFLLSLVVVGCLALAAAGCGGSSTLGKQELITKADGVCRDERRVVAQELGSAPNFPAAIAAYDAGDVRIDTAFERRLRDLKPPKSEKSTWNAYLASREQSLSLARREGAAARRGDQRTLQAFGAQRQAGAQQRARLADRVGLRVCGSQRDVPDLLGPPQPSGPPPSRVHYIKPKSTLSAAATALASARTCVALRALQNSDDTKYRTAECQQLLSGLRGLRVRAQDDFGPIGVVDFEAAGGHGTALFVEDAKDGRLKLSSVVPFEAGVVHKAQPGNDAAGNMAATVAAIGRNDGTAFHRLVSENSSFSTKPSRKVDLSGPTGSGLRLKKDLAADRAAKPETLGIDILYGFFALKANGHNYVLINIKGPTGYKWIGFYPQPAG